eukprot:6193997-Pleurochrysis_carterae.AAC.2
MEAIEQVALSIKQLQLPASERVVDSPPCGRTAKREHLPGFPLEAMLKVTQPCSPAQPLHHQAGAAENHASGVEVVILPLSRLSEMDLLTGHGKSKRSPFARLILARENRCVCATCRELLVQHLDDAAHMLSLRRFANVHGLVLKPCSGVYATRAFVPYVLQDFDAGPSPFADDSQSI